jgi:predicted permease
MKLAAMTWSFLRAALRRSQMEREMDDEMQFHLEARAADLRARGVPPAEAERRAREEFGDMIRWKEAGRESRGLRLVDELRADLRYAARTLRRSPGFTLAAVASLALGIGANAAIFSLLDVLVMKPLPVREPRTLVQIMTAGEDGRIEAANYPWCQELAARTDLFSDLFAVRQNVFKVQIAGRVEPVAGQFVTESYFQALDVRAVHGRTLMPDDHREGASSRVAVISYGFWQRRFGGDLNVLGTSIVVDRHPYTIVGVTAPEFFGLQVGWTMDVTMPFAVIAARHNDPGNWSTIPIVARLKAGVERERAAAEVDAMLKRFVADHVESGRFRRNYLQRAEVQPVSNGFGALRDEFSPSLRLLMAAVGLLLLIACVNLAGLLVARNTARHRELGIRLALGAGRGRIVRQLLTESALLSILGTVPGVIFALWGSNLLIAFVPEYYGPLTLSVTADTRLLGFTILVASITVLLFGGIPAYQATRVAAAPALSGGPRHVTTLRIGLGRTLVAAQFALSLVLVTGALLLVRSMMNLARVDAGFERDGVLIVQIDAPGSDYEGEKMRQFQREMPARLAALPGVVHATVATTTPLNGNENGRRIAVRGVVPRGDEDVVAQVNGVGPSYFAVFGIPMVEGRPIDERDTANAPSAAVVSETFARHYFGASSALGREVTIGRGESARTVQIVGVAKEVRFRSLRGPGRRVIYVSQFQEREVQQEYFEFALRTAGDPANWVAMARAEILRLRPDAPVLQVLTLRNQINKTLTREWLLASLGTFFAVVALALAAIGVYGLLAYVVARRVPEIGVRLALGAQPRMMWWMTLRESLALAAVGTGVGLAIAAATLRVLNSLLFGLSATDGVTLLGAAALLTIVGLIAGFIPARRAAAVDPLVAIRCE